MCFLIVHESLILFSLSRIQCAVANLLMAQYKQISHQDYTYFDSYCIFRQVYL